MVLGQTVFENLVEYDVDGVLKPQLAKALPTISDDKKTYVFDLREDVTFHNGKPMTAETSNIRSTTSSTRPTRRRGSLFTRIAKVTVLGPHKVQFDLSEPYGRGSTSHEIHGHLPTGSRKEHGDDYFKSRPAGMGTGFGIFEEWKPNDYVSFKKNPNYWPRTCPSGRLVVKMIPEDATRVAYLLTGQVDLISARRARVQPAEDDALRHRRFASDARGALLMYTNN